MQYEMKTCGEIISPSKMCQIFGKTLKFKIACDEEIMRGLILVNACYHSVQNFPFT
jgi:S-adenosylmethionine/arginine decarboxylase-like enzyme